jgi:hypothetical protein
MRLLCDQNVARRYIDACVDAPDLHAVTVRGVLDPRASDADIAAHAATHDYVVFTSDDDFFELADRCGFVYYHQPTVPAVGDVLEALRAIGNAYDDHSEIVEVVPGDWI